MTDRHLVPTQSALLELKEERGILREGYRFLDEKRLILAAEILGEIGRYEREKAAFDADYASAGRALEGAVMRHGLDELALYPAAPETEAQFALSERRVLGVALRAVELTSAVQSPTEPTLAASPEAEVCRAAFLALLPRAARLASLAGNLERLRADYARTARRARALEDVLLPEIDVQVGGLETLLDELEREEAVRARRGRG